MGRLFLELDEWDDEDPLLPLLRERARPEDPPEREEPEERRDEDSDERERRRGSAFS